MSDLKNSILTGDCMDVIGELPANSVHAIVTDPPYGLNFMGEDWDNFRRKNNQADSGRDDVFGRTSSTSPAHGAETDGERYQEWCEDWAREVKHALKPGGHLLAFSGNRTHHRLFSGVEDAGFEIRDTITWHYGSGFPKGLNVSNGWNTTLKPATEFVAVGRAPLSEGKVAENVQTHGTGALNIGETRIGYESTDDLKKTKAKNPGREGDVTSEVYGNDRPQQKVDVSGRHPPNVTLDSEAAEKLDRSMGELPGDGPSRYFYTSKASSRERTLDGKIENKHPTVKPTDLMQWLVTLVTSKGQTVLDPFAGTGTTCLSAKKTSRKFIGIEKEPKWADVARVRCGLAADDPAHVRPGENSGLDDFK